MITHSPLPWGFGPVDRSPRNIEAANGDGIAKVYLTNAQTRQRDAEHLGNARILLGAGAMYEALCAFRDEFGWALERDEPLPGADTVAALCLMWPSIQSALAIVEASAL